MCTIRNPARKYREHMALHDEAAAARLRREVHRQYETHRKERFTKTGLAVATGHSRPTLDNWLVHGKMPDTEGMANLANAVGVPASQLWVKWLDLSTSDPLVRIADALERAYPVPSEDQEVADRVESAERSNPAQPTHEASAARSSPPSTTGSKGGR